MGKPVKKVTNKNTNEIISETIDVNINNNINDNIINENINENTNENINETEVAEMIVTSVSNDSIEGDKEYAPIESTSVESTETSTEVLTTQSSTSSTFNIDVNKLLSTIEYLQKQVEELTEKQKESQKEVKTTENVVTQQPFQTVVPMPVPVKNSTSETTQLLNYLANKKSDKEVTIVHNMELSGGLSTAIKLTGLSIDFHTLGEQRVLSFQQFEECVSKYLSWFNKKIILLSYEDRDLASKYNIPYVGQDNHLTLTREWLNKVGKMSVEQLQDFYNKLCPEDQNSLCSYWIGKCYERIPDFYNRYKVECLNRLSNKGAFDNILVNMNNDFMRNKVDTIGSNNTATNNSVGGIRKTPIIEAVEI